MQKCDVPHTRWLHLRKLIPTFILIGIAVLAGGTDVFSEQVHRIVSKSIHDRFIEITPYFLNFVLAAIALNIAYLLYHPCECGAERFLSKTSASDRMRGFVMKSLRLLYWGGVVFFVASFFAQELMAKLALGAGLITAAITFAINGLLNDFVSGLLLQGADRIKEGDEVKVEGVTGAEGKVVKIDYVQTVIKTESGDMAIPNGKIWGNATTRKKVKSPIIEATTGWYNRREEPETDKDKDKDGATDGSGDGKTGAKS